MLVIYVVVEIINRRHPSSSYTNSRHSYILLFLPFCTPSVVPTPITPRTTNSIRIKETPVPPSHPKRALARRIGVQNYPSRTSGIPEIHQLHNFAIPPPDCIVAATPEPPDSPHAGRNYHLGDRNTNAISPQLTLAERSPDDVGCGDDKYPSHQGPKD